MEITAQRAIEIMHQLQNGNNQNFYELYKACVKYLKGISHRKNYRFWSDWGREDYCEEVMIEVWKKRNQYDENRGAFTTWLAQIESSVYNKAYNKKNKWNTISMYQRDEDNNEVNIIDLYVSSGSSEQEVIFRDSYERMLHALEKLSKDQRTAFVLCCIEGMKPAQVVEIMGCKIQDVYNWKKRAIDKIKSFMECEALEMCDDEREL